MLLHVSSKPIAFYRKPRLPSAIPAIRKGRKTWTLAAGPPCLGRIRCCSRMNSCERLRLLAQQRRQEPLNAPGIPQGLCSCAAPKSGSRDPADGSEQQQSFLQENVGVYVHRVQVVYERAQSRLKTSKSQMKQIRKPQARAHLLAVASYQAAATAAEAAAAAEFNLVGCRLKGSPHCQQRP